MIEALVCRYLITPLNRRKHRRAAISGAESTTRNNRVLPFTAAGQVSATQTPPALGDNTISRVCWRNGETNHYSREIAPQLCQ